MITLYNEETSAALGEITEAQLKFLEEQLVEEGTEDADYFINLDTVDLLTQRGADADLVALLKQAIGTTEGIEITWSDEA